MGRGWMERSAAEQLISDLYKYALGRQPDLSEFQTWVSFAVNGAPAEELVRKFYESEEFRKRSPVASAFPAGHFHSPVVDPTLVADYVSRERRTAVSDIAGINIPVDQMRRLWLANLEFIRTTPFTEGPDPKNRYNYTGGPFPWADGITLRMMIRHLRPKRIVEIGSGYSTACMLDSAEHVDLRDLHITCIEPYPTRLKALLRPRDSNRVTLIERGIQDVPLNIVDALGENDILFIDSTHVLKTGSDVHCEMFHLLPRIKPGVVVHFHDIHFPFEYPDDWIFKKNYSWNEAYILRAFLMFNREFRIFFWNPLYAHVFASSIRDEYPAFLRNSGGSIWIERVAPAMGGSEPI